MKRSIAAILCIAMIVSVFMMGACKKPTTDTVSPSPTADQGKTDTSAPAVSIRVAALKGPTGMGIVKLVGDEYPNYNVSIEASPEALAPRFISGDVDVAAVPVNLASVLYNKLGGDVVVLGVTTLGVLSVLENGDSITSFKDLDGKKIYATGQGATPEYILNYLLEKNGVSAEVEYVGEHAALATMLANGDAEIGMLPQPNVTAALNSSEKLRVALDLTEEWNKVSDAQLVQGVVIAKKSFAESNKQAIDAFIADYAASVEFVNNNIDEASKLIAEVELLPEEGLAKKAIPGCNITFIGGLEMKNAVSAMLGVLFEANPQSIGGALPADEFYYGTDVK